MAEMWRMFIAIHLPPDVLAGLTKIQDDLKERAPSRTVKWVNPQGIHLTLKFLGDVAVIKRDSIQRALTQAVQDHASFDLAAGGLGCFPNARQPRVVWVGMHQNLQALARLHDSVEENMTPLGYPPENRPFNPHLTLGRTRREANRSDLAQLGELVTHTPANSRYPFRVEAVSLFRSELKSTGAVYTELLRAPLK
jgi:2'-5' RNA ligase